MSKEETNSKTAAKEEKAEAPKEEKKTKKKAKKTKAKKTSTKKAETKEAPKTTAKADDLKVLKGLGPALEQKLKAAGMNSLEEMAKLTDNDIEALDAKVAGFKQRYLRYDWRGQAKAALEQ